MILSGNPFRLAFNKYLHFLGFCFPVLFMQKLPCLPRQGLSREVWVFGRHYFGFWLAFGIFDCCFDKCKSTSSLKPNRRTHQSLSPTLNPRFHKLCCGLARLDIIKVAIAKCLSFLTKAMRKHISTSTCSNRQRPPKTTMVFLGP